MRNRLLAFSIATITFLGTAHVVVGCASDSNDGPGGGDSSTEAGFGNNDGNAKKANGASCGSAGECATGYCSDGVCCESACTGTCEACNIIATVGKCAPIAEGDDPANECGATPPRPDAGSDYDAGDAGDAGDAEAGLPFAAPDGGVKVDDNPCAKKCNGKRACGFPGTEKSCGPAFCGNTSEQGRPACDGKGYCNVVVEECSPYACPDGSQGCKKSCASPNDCDLTHFCDGSTNTCKPKLANGVAAGTAAQCQSGYLANGVCCNDSCDYASASCNQAGHVGECRCTACSTGACSLWYRDIDGDGYGDKTGTVANGRAKPGCTNPADGTVAGFVQNNQDCFDDDSDKGRAAHPGQTGFFSAGYGADNSFDYNCDNNLSKQYREYSAVSCKVCSGSYYSCSTTTSCGTTSKPSGLGCNGLSQIIILGGALMSTSSPSAIIPTPIPIRSCTTNTEPGLYTSTALNCGQSAPSYTCGTCPAYGTAPSPTYGGNLPQGCH